ncbi:hypothetical protein Pth03_18110 [Planotetraspora thailandica]|uniref:HTH luxR-type domain-containing protein n=1 Tax=Planotetraspora thailandica TaxID=487172 RepID=A0A8J3XSN2_9ACTN|nr:LuxR family transcriptional regulator [Planotetraspora thailandica]GII53422.1 hypothetical protein Pth03_18110 [Planotetraspora thailandica]
MGSTKEEFIDSRFMEPPWEDTPAPSHLSAALDPALDPLPPVRPAGSRFERAPATRVGGLPGPVRDVLLVAAVASVNELPEILAAAALLAGRDVGVDVLDRARAAGLLHFDEMHVHFRSPLVRVGILRRETVPRRQAANAALAAVLSGEPHRRVWHLAQSIVGPDDDVADELESSHRLHLRHGWIMAAVRVLERSAQLTSDPAVRGRRLLIAAQHALCLGRAGVTDQLLRAAGRYVLSPLDRTRMEWLREVANDGVPGDATRVAELCDAAERAAHADDHDLALDLLLGAALRCWWADAGSAARTAVVRTAGRLDADLLTGTGGRPADARLVATLAVAAPVTSGAIVIDQLSRVAVESVTDSGDMHVLGLAAHAAGDDVRASDLLDRSEARLREQERVWPLAHVRGTQALVRLSTGDWDQAADAAQEGRRLAERTGQPIWTAVALAAEAMVTALRGDAAPALDLAAQAERLAGRGRLDRVLGWARLARGYAWISGCHYAEAYQELLPLFDPRGSRHHRRELFAGVIFLVEAATHSGHHDEARAVLAGLEEIAAVTPSPLLHVQLLHARALLADDDEAESRFLAALGEDLTRWPWVRARIELAYGTWLRRRRRVAESRAPLRAAQATLDLIGASAWAEQARAELRAAGERAPSPGPAGTDMLSAQELQIARLAAEGMTNREIGRQLYLSPRTVGSHLYRIFPKLNVTSRAQLSARLASL